jgi:hypothetical protein
MFESKKIIVPIIIVTWNNQKEIEDCISSYLKQTYSNIKVIVVDNASSDKSCEIIKDKFPEVELIESKKNLFFTGGYNLGMNRAISKYHSEFVLISNPDVIASPTMVSELVRSIKKDPKVGACGPKIYYFEPKNKIYSAGLTFDGFMMACQRGNGEIDDNNNLFNIREKVFGVEGTCILFRTEMLNNIGLFWNTLKMYSEDVELFIRANKVNWKSIYEPKAVLWHKVFASTSQNKNMNIEKQKMRNWLLIALRHYKIKSKLAMVKKYFEKHYDKIK